MAGRFAAMAFLTGVVTAAAGCKSAGETPEAAAVEAPSGRPIAVRISGGAGPSAGPAARPARPESPPPGGAGPARGHGVDGEDACLPLAAERECLAAEDPVRDRCSAAGGTVVVCADCSVLCSVPVASVEDPAPPPNAPAKSPRTPGGH